MLRINILMIIIMILVNSLLLRAEEITEECASLEILSSTNTRANMFAFSESGNQLLMAESGHKLLNVVNSKDMQVRKRIKMQSAPESIMLKDNEWSIRSNNKSIINIKCNNYNISQSIDDGINMKLKGEFSDTLVLESYNKKEILFEPRKFSSIGYVNIRYFCVKHSSDNKYISYNIQPIDDIKGGLYILDISSKNENRIEKYGYDSVWGPCNNVLLYNTYIEIDNHTAGGESYGDLYLYYIKEKKRVRLTYDENITEIPAAITKDAKRVAFIKQGKLHIADVVYEKKKEE